MSKLIQPASDILGPDLQSPVDISQLVKAEIQFMSGTCQALGTSDVSYLLSAINNFSVYLFLRKRERDTHTQSSSGGRAEREGHRI